MSRPTTKWATTFLFYLFIFKDVVIYLGACLDGLARGGTSLTEAQELVPFYQTGSFRKDAHGEGRSA